MKITFISTWPAWDKAEIRGEFAAGLAAGIQVMHLLRTKVKFTEAGARSYRFKQRNRGYRKKKRAKWGHNKPNVWSGTGRAQVLRPLKTKALKARASATGTIKARFLNLSNALGWHMEDRGLRKFKVRNFRRNPDHKGEMEKLLRPDEKIIARIAKEHTTKFFDTKGRKKTTRI